MYVYVIYLMLVPNHLAHKYLHIYNLYDMFLFIVYIYIYILMRFLMCAQHISIL